MHKAHHPRTHTGTQAHILHAARTRQTRSALSLPQISPARRTLTSAAAASDPLVPLILLLQLYHRRRRRSPRPSAPTPRAPRVLPLLVAREIGALDSMGSILGSVESRVASWKVAGAGGGSCGRRSQMGRPRCASRALRPFSFRQGRQNLAFFGRPLQSTNQRAAVL